MFCCFAQPAGPAGRRRAGGADRRRRLDGGARLERAPDRGHRSAGRGRAREPQDHAGHDRAAAVRRAAAAAGADPRRRCPRRGAGIAAETVAGRPQGGAGAAAGDAAAARQHRRSGSATGSRTAPPSARRLCRRPRHVRYIGAKEADAPRLLAADAAPGDLAGKDFGVVVRTLPAPVPRPLVVRASGEEGAPLAARAGDDRAPATAASRCGWRCRPNCATASPGSSSKARNRPAPCCWSMSAGGGARSASPRRRTPPGSRCSARTTISNARSGRSPKCAAAAPPIS